MKSENYYRLVVNNTTNILSGSGLTRFTIRLPLTFGSIIGKPVKLYVQDLFILQNDGATTIAVDLISLGSGIYQENSWGSSTGTNDYTLTTVSPALITGQSGDVYVRTENPSDPIYIPSLPNTLDFYLINTMTGAQITIPNANNTWVATICIEGCDCIPDGFKEYY